VVNQNDKIMEALVITAFILGFIIYIFAGRILINLFEDIDMIPLIIDSSWRVFTHLFWPLFILWNLLCKAADNLSNSLF